MNKLLIICGPTSTGKTGLGIKIARKFGGEVVNADSRQVYRGMDIVTGKDIPLLTSYLPPPITHQSCLAGRQALTINHGVKNGVPVWLVDIVEPNYIFNVGEYRKFALIVIQDIVRRGKLPIVVGGTGLYIKSLIDPLKQIEIAPNPKLRKKLEKLKVEELVSYLKKINQKKWQSMNPSDRFNPRRLIRAIEISSSDNATIQQFNNQGFYENLSYLLIGLKTNNQKLYNLIDKRVEKRIEEGAVDELQKLFKKGYDIDLLSMSAAGYRELKKYIDGKISLNAAISSWKYREHFLARRQLTWFNKMIAEYGGFWFDIGSNKFIKQIEEKVGKWYTK